MLGSQRIQFLEIEGWVNFNDTVDVVMVVVDGSGGVLLRIGVEQSIAP